MTPENPLTGVYPKYPEDYGVIPQDENERQARADHEAEMARMDPEALDG